MAGDLEADGGGGDADQTIQEDTQAASSETENLVFEAKSSLVMLICTILFMSLLSILLSTWLAKTITNTSTSFTTIIGRYFGFDRNETESSLTWWTPLHKVSIHSASRNGASNRSNSTTAPAIPLQIPYSDYPTFHTITLPLLFIGAILSAVVAYYARIKCTDRGFAWGAIPKVPLGRVDPIATAAVIAAADKAQEAKGGVDYDILPGSKEEPGAFALADPLQTFNEEREAGAIIDEGTQYDIEDIPKVIAHISSAPDLQANNQTVPSLPHERQHMIELLQRQPLTTVPPSI